MSFTAEVRNELSRVDARCPGCELAELSAIVRVCGTLSFLGKGRYSLRIVTASGAVARIFIKLAHKLFNLETSLTMRRSRLHKTRNYLIELPPQRALEPALLALGVLDADSTPIAGVPSELVERECCAASYLRGAFMAGGFIADPRGDLHLEVSVSSERHAHELVELLGRFGVKARVNHRRGQWVVYLKSFRDIKRTLETLGATRTVLLLEGARNLKQKKSDANRMSNAEFANLTRSSNAGAEQASLVEDVIERIGLDDLPPALRDFCLIRRDNPDLSLSELGALLDPPVSKSALYHRVLRLQSLLAETSDE